MILNLILDQPGGVEFLKKIKGLEIPDSNFLEKLIDKIFDVRRRLTIEFNNLMDLPIGLGSASGAVSVRIRDFRASECYIKIEDMIKIID